jgi:Family of unknown function (DUF6503)
MKPILFLAALVGIPFSSISQNPTGYELLYKTISYHDPNGNWESFNGKLFITMETPNNTNRDSEIHIDLPGEYFYVKATRDAITTEYTLVKGDCTIAFNGSTDISETIIKENNLSCERANLYKNYYTYLYGLPMKLKDPGTIVNRVVERISFKDKEYLLLKVTYDENVGSDVWYFYFDPNTYAIKIYQFFKGTPDAEGKNTGEYILLTEETTVNGMKIPKVRTWYYNKDDKYLGTDILK